MRASHLHTVVPGFLLLVIACASGQEAESDAKSTPPGRIEAPESAQTKAPEGEQDEGERSMSEILRSAQPAPMPIEKPPEPDAPTDAEKARVATSDPEAVEPPSDPESEIGSEDSRGRAEPSRPPEPSAAPPERDKSDG